MQRFEFPGKVCVITGAASGIGAALALDLGRRGARLALVDRDKEGLAAAAAEAATGAGAAEVATYHADLSDRGDRLDLAADVIDRYGRVDLLINNAGVALGGMLHEVSLDDIDWLLQINLWAVIATTKAFLPHLMANPGAHVVNVSSVFGIAAPPGQAAYATSKFGVRGFTEALRHELAPLGIGVTVVHPGGVATNIATNARVGALVEAARDPDGAKQDFNKLLRLPPSAAAAQILDAVHRRKPRLLITGAAKALDRLVRMRPGTYWTPLARLARRRGGGS